MLCVNDEYIEKRTGVTVLKEMYIVGIINKKV